MPSTPLAMKIVLAREGHTVETGARIAAGLPLREPTGGTVVEVPMRCCGKWGITRREIEESKAVGVA